MRYFANPSKGEVAEAMSAGTLGCITTPKQGNRVPVGAVFCCDNGRYGKGWPGYDKWFTWVQRMLLEYGTDRCAFVVAPDAPMDAKLTYYLSKPWLARIRALGAPVAYCAQNGAEAEWPPPWDDIDVLFIAGDTEWKLTHGMALAHEAKKRGLKVHVGRVNSMKRWHHIEAWGADTCDGTYLTFGPRTNLPKLLAWGKAPRQIGIEEAIRSA